MKKRLYLTWAVGLLIMICSTAKSQSNGHWNFASKDFTIPKGQLMQAQFPKAYKIARLNVPAMYVELSKVYQKSGELPIIPISVPNPEGSYSDFFISPSDVVADEVANLYTVRTFKGYAKNSREVTIRCDISPTGFHAVVFTGGVTYAIEPASHSDVNTHMVYYKNDLEVPGFKCGIDDTHKGKGYKPFKTGSTRTPVNLRTYRLAIIADATFRTQFGGGPYNATNVLNSFASGMNMVNEVYERDLGVHLTLVSNVACADAVLTDHTDINAVHTFIVNSSGLGSGGFEVGHSLLWSNTGGVAYLGVVCNNSFKGGGFSGATGSVTQLYVDYMAHELGHQFGANHTFVSAECGTSEPNFRYEPGEGSTIMAYAGVCGAPPSYQSFSDPFFHAASIAEINTYIASGGTCAAISTPGTGNNDAPSVNAQSDFTIPKQTPFILVGTGSDANADPVSYSWEQFNGAGTATTGSPNCTSTSQPLFRFRPPVNNNYRIFPQMSDVLAGNNNTQAWEKLPCIARTLNFRITARDNNTNWGRTNSDNVVVTVANTGPFDVTAPNGGESWQANSAQSVTWTVNGTDSHCANVDILISTDNGVTYTLVGTFPNNGTAGINVPNTPSTTARVLVQCSVGGNFRSASTFFDVSNAMFSITAPPPCGDVRISQVYGGGGNSGAPYTHDFIEIYNGGPSTVNLSGYSVQYASSTGTSWTGANLNGTIASGKYYLVRLATGGANGAALPTPDATGTMNMSVAAGKVALVSSTTALTVACPSGAQIIDFVGYGTAANCSESANGPAHSNTTAILRDNNGCTDDNNNSTDFATGAPSPRNSVSSANNCGLVLTVTDNVCPSNPGTILGSGCGAGTVLEYATNEAGPWSITAPTYTTSAMTVYVRCRNTTTSCSGPVVNGTTAPTTCSTCPTFSVAPANVSIINSTCSSNVVSGGSITAPGGIPCPAGSVIQYQVNGGGWSTILPTYNQTGPAQSIKTRCSCVSDPLMNSAESLAISTIPGTCGPANDLCINATPIVTNGGNICGTTIGAGADNPNGAATCGTGADAEGDGVWYTFTGDGQTWDFLFPTAAGWDPEVNVYSGTCFALVCEGGDDDSGPGFDAQFSIPTVSGTNYYVYVHSAFTATTPAPPVMLTCPTNITAASCQPQEAVNGQFADWLATASGTGGCDGMLTNNSTGAPSACGGSTIVTFTYTSTCGVLTSTCQATFTVAAPTVLALTCPANIMVAECQTQTAVNAQFEAWLLTASASGGCNAVLTTNNTGAPAATGGSTQVTFTYTSNCSSASCQAIFTVSPPTLACGWSAEPNGVGCNAGNNVAYNPGNQVFTVTSTNCYYPNSFTSDALAFAQHDLCGNGSITAEVTSITGNALGWAGVTMRENNTAGAKKAQLMTNLSTQSRREFRTTTNGAAYPQQFPSQNRYWLRITRTGNQFAMYISQNGTSWSFNGTQTIVMGNCIEVGLVVTNYTANSTVTANFANVSVTGGNITKPAINTQEDILTAADFSIFPNPTNGLVEIDLSSYHQRKVEMELYNLQGKLLRSINIESVKGKEEIDLTSFANGMYLIRVRAEGIPDVTKRVVVNSNY